MTRSRQTLLAYGSGIFLGMVLAGICAPRILNALRLADDGKVAVAKITAIKNQLCGKREKYPCPIYFLSAEGRQFQVFLPENRAVGTEVTIVYSPRDSAVVLPGQRSGSRWDDLYRRASEQRDIDVSLGLGGILVAFGSLIGFLINLRRNAA